LRRRASFTGTKFGGGGKRGRAKIPGGHSLSNPLPFYPPKRSVSVSAPPQAEQSVGILFKMSSDFFQQTPNVTFYWHGTDTIRHNPGKVIPFEFKINLYNYLKSNFKTAKVHLS